MGDSPDKLPQGPNQNADARLATAESTLGIGQKGWKRYLSPDRTKRMNPVIAILAIPVLLVFCFQGTVEVLGIATSAFNTGVIQGSTLNPNSKDWPIPIFYNIRLDGNSQTIKSEYICRGLRSERSCNSSDIVPNGTKVRLEPQPDGTLAFGSVSADIGGFFGGLFFIFIGVSGIWYVIRSVFRRRPPSADPQTSAI